MQAGTPGLPAPGDVIWIRRRRWRVEHARRDRHVVRLDVASRDRRLTFLAPFDRPDTAAPSDRPVRLSERAALARLAHVISRAHGVRTITAAIGARVALLPHQLEPALAASAGARRLLIADEVGLGKTIQAALIVADVCRRQIAARVLLIVPAALREQWRRELSGRFGLSCLDADRASLDERSRAAARGQNPWRQSGIWIASIDFLKQSHVFDAMPAQPWDLVVIDEAHTVCGESQRHAVSDDIAQRSRMVVLLTATPHDGDAVRFNRLLDLGALDAEAVDDRLAIFRRVRAESRPGPAPRVRRLVIQPTEAERRVLDALQEFERRVLAATRTEGLDAALLLLAVFRKRALSSFAALAISLERRLAWIGGGSPRSGESWLQFRFAFEDADDLNEEDQDALLGRLDLPPERERRWLGRLLELASAARQRDSRLARVVALLARTREPVVVFTEFRHTLDALHRRLRRGRSVAMLHGGQTDAERTRELDRFLAGGADVLLATDVASLGLNLQSRARWIISLDVPWTPARLEQRAGRVDRLGQTRPVHITLLVSRHEAEARLVEQLSRRADAARRAIGEDVFVTTPPDTALRAWIIAGVPLPGLPPAAESPRITLCTRWKRTARLHAGVLARQRARAGQWRASQGLDARPGRCLVRRRGAWSELVAPAAVIFTVPLLDGTGLVLERHVVAVRLADGLPSNRRIAKCVMEHARQLAAERLTPRIRVLTRRIASLAAATRARERVIHDDFDRRAAGEAQPGLFDARAVRQFERTELESSNRRDDRDAHDAALDEATHVKAGRPVLELIFEVRR